MRKLLLVLALVGLVARPASGSVIIDVSEVGGDVVFTVTGSLDLTGATFFTAYAAFDNGLISGGTNWWIGSGPGTSTAAYDLTGSAGAFGTGGVFFDAPTSVSGANFFIWGFGGGIPKVGVPLGYSSGASISSGMIFAGSTIAGLTMVPGTYVYSLPNDTITLNIAQAQAVPEPASLLLLGTGLGALAARRRLKKPA